MKKLNKKQGKELETYNKGFDDGYHYALEGIEVYIKLIKYKEVKTKWKNKKTYSQEELGIKKESSL